MSAFSRYYETIKVIGNRRYRYNQAVRRVGGGRIETLSRYVGPVDGPELRPSVAGQFPQDEARSALFDAAAEATLLAQLVAMARAESPATGTALWWRHERVSEERPARFSVDARLGRLARAFGYRGLARGGGAALIDERRRQLTLPAVTRFDNEGAFNHVALGLIAEALWLRRAAPLSSGDEQGAAARLVGGRVVAEIGGQVAARRLGLAFAETEGTAWALQVWQRAGLIDAAGLTTLAAVVADIAGEMAAAWQTEAAVVSRRRRGGNR